jgi:hypothetical protein
MSNLPEDQDTRAERKDNEEPGYLARTRKATMSGAVALATALSGSILIVTQDGIVTAAEAGGAAVIALGVGAAAWFATWAVPNAPEN